MQYLNFVLKFNNNDISYLRVGLKAAFIISTFKLIQYFSPIPWEFDMTTPNIVNPFSLFDSPPSRFKGKASATQSRLPSTSRTPLSSPKSTKSTSCCGPRSGKPSFRTEKPSGSSTKPTLAWRMTSSSKKPSGSRKARESSMKPEARSTRTSSRKTSR